MNTVSPDIPSKPSRNVVINHRLRTLASVLFVLIYASLADLQDNLPGWVLIGLVLIWPQLFFWIANRATSGYQAERIHVLLDGIVCGVLIPVVEFRLWPATVMIIIEMLNLLTYGGWRLALKGIGMLAAGILLGGIIFGFNVHLDTEPLPVVMSILTILAYISFIGAAVYRIRMDYRTNKVALESEQEKSQQLLHKVFPEAVIPRLNAGENPIADEFADVTVLFSDIVGYTPMAEQLGPRKTVMLLNELYKNFDQIVAQHGVEKVETIGDGYLAVGGAPERNDEHPEAVAQCALAMVEAAKEVMVAKNEPVQIRIGLHTGPIFAGVIGEHRFHYDIFGETVNVASRIQGHSRPGSILVSDATYKRIRGSYRLEECGSHELKGHGPMRTYWLLRTGEGS